LIFADRGSAVGQRWSNSCEIAVRRASWFTAARRTVPSVGRNSDSARGDTDLEQLFNCVRRWGIDGILHLWMLDGTADRMTVSA
jgi:hypothetical protein